MIGTCECCDRQNVPISHIDTVFGIEAFACYLCRGETDPDPYGELQDENDCNSPFDIPNDPVMPPHADYTAWLIEIDGRDLGYPEQGPFYFQFVFDDDWTNDHDKAVHFGRKQDAERAIEHYGWTQAKPVEHMWGGA